MLRKLLKHELVATSRLLLPIYLVLLFLSAANRLVQSLGGYEGVLERLLAVTSIMYVVATIAVTGIFLIIRFYKSLLTDEGYLMFTLPVKSSQLILSKLMIAVFWSISCILLMAASLFIVAANKETLSVLVEYAGEGLNLLQSMYGGKWILLLGELALISLLTVVSSILMVYASIAVGQLLSKHKVVGAFISFAIANTVIQFLGIRAAAFYMDWVSDSFRGIIQNPEMHLLVWIAVLLIGCVGFFFGTNYVLQRRLNLD